ncbi:uncharacterized protein [Periplaneta americana]|uniref:uncharacterized protein n=1 Tax=Periplaneta americana TaxID=6978 RepID=UPI0037E9C33C
MTSPDEKFVYLVQEREAIYNAKLKEHHNKNILEGLWREIAIEMNMSSNECKAKWTNLRNSFARHLRDMRNIEKSGGAKMKKTWYLADIMSFLQEHVQHRKSRSNPEYSIEDFVSVDYSDEEKETQREIKMEVIPKMEILPEVTDQEDHLQQDVPQASMHHAEFDSQRLRKRPRRALPPDQFVEYTRSQPVHPLLSFFTGLLEDYNTLTPKRQRLFKQNCLGYLNYLLDEQEASE